MGSSTRTPFDFKNTRDLACQLFVVASSASILQQYIQQYTTLLQPSIDKIPSESLEVTLLGEEEVLPTEWRFSHCSHNYDRSKLLHPSPEGAASDDDAGLGIFT